MSRLVPHTRVLVAIVVGAMLLGGGLAPNIHAAPAPDRSEVVLVFDFSASILKDARNRNRFGAALEQIADRVDAISADLVAGDATVTFIQFATKAADYKGCTDLRLLGNAPAVARFANCLRLVAGAYRKGLDPKLTKRLGVDTNYVAAMNQAARHLPLDSVRPAMILFTDGKHDVKGVPLSEVRKDRTRLFGTRTPLALLPVGMGLQSKERGALEAGLVRMRIIRNMPACVSGATFDWPQVVFKSAAEAGNAVAVALQDATCTFTVEAPPTPAPTPAPTPTPTPKPAAVQSIRVKAGDSRIEVAWTPVPAAAAAAPIVDYRIRCGVGDAGWVESKEGKSLDRTAVVEGLTNGTAYRCEVAAVGASGEGPWTAADATATPFGPPPAPGKPTVEPFAQALRVSVTADDPASVTGFRFECSGDGGATWSTPVDVASADKPTAPIMNLTNGVAYVCRAFAVNTIGPSAASPVSDAVRPCGSGFECNPVLAPIIGVLGIALVGGMIMVLVALRRIRRRGYVLAVVDNVHAANLGYGSKLGMGFVRAPSTRHVTGVVADRGRNADIRIRHLGGGRFVVTDRVGRHVATDGEPITAVDSVGGRHLVVLRAFNTNAASAVSSRS